MRHDSSLGCFFRGGNITWRDTVKTKQRDERRYGTPGRPGAIRSKKSDPKGLTKKQVKYQEAKARKQLREEAKAREEAERVRVYEARRAELAPFFNNPVIKAIKEVADLVAQDDHGKGWNSTKKILDDYKSLYAKEIPTSFRSMMLDVKSCYPSKRAAIRVAIDKILKAAGC